MKNLFDLLKVKMLSNVESDYHEKVFSVIEDIKKEKGFIPNFVNDEKYREETLKDLSETELKERANEFAKEAAKFIKNYNMWEVKVSDLESNEIELMIPIYQRKYKWTPELITSFFKEMIKANKDIDKNLGNILTFEENNEGSYKKVSIVDGQQRLTTILLLKTYILVKFATDEKFREDMNKINSTFLNKRLSEFYSKVLKFKLDSVKDNENLFLKSLNKIVDHFKENANVNFNDAINDKAFISKLNDLTPKLFGKLDFSAVECNTYWLNVGSFRFYLISSRTEVEAYDRFYKVNSMSLPLQKFEIYRSLLFKEKYLNSSNMKLFDKIVHKDSELQFYTFFIEGRKYNGPSNAFVELRNKIKLTGPLVSEFEKDYNSFTLDNYSNNFFDQFWFNFIVNENMNKDIYRTLFVINSHLEVKPNDAMVVNSFLKKTSIAWIVYKDRKKKNKNLSFPKSNAFDGKIKALTKQNSYTEEGRLFTLDIANLFDDYFINGILNESEKSNIKNFKNLITKAILEQSKKKEKSLTSLRLEMNGGVLVCADGKPLTKEHFVCESWITNGTFSKKKYKSLNEEVSNEEFEIMWTKRNHLNKIIQKAKKICIEYGFSLNKDNIFNFIEVTSSLNSKLDDKMPIEKIKIILSESNIDDLYMPIEDKTKFIELMTPFANINDEEYTEDLEIKLVEDYFKFNIERFEKMIDKKIET